MSKFAVDPAGHVVAVHEQFRLKPGWSWHVAAPKTAPIAPPVNVPAPVKKAALPAEE